MDVSEQVRKLELENAELRGKVAALEAVVKLMAPIRQVPVPYYPYPIQIQPIIPTIHPLTPFPWEFPNDWAITKTTCGIEQATATSAICWHPGIS